MKGYCRGSQLFFFLEGQRKFKNLCLRAKWTSLSEFFLYICIYSYIYPARCDQRAKLHLLAGWIGDVANYALCCSSRKCNCAWALPAEVGKNCLWVKISQKFWWLRRRSCVHTVNNRGRLEIATSAIGPAGCLLRISWLLVHFGECKEVLWRFTFFVITICKCGKYVYSVNIKTDHVGNTCAQHFHYTKFRHCSPCRTLDSCLFLLANQNRYANQVLNMHILWLQTKWVVLVSTITHIPSFVTVAHTELHICLICCHPEVNLS